MVRTELTRFQGSWSVAKRKMDHKAVILLMLVCFVIMTLCVATPTISYSSSKPYSSHTQREDGLYDDGLYHHMASGLTSPQPHSVSDQDFVLNGRELLEDVNQIPSSVMDSMYDYNKRDVEALLTLKDTIKYDPSGSLSNWKAEKAEKVCSWPGISCNGQDSENVCPWNGMPCRQPNQRVVAIILPGLGLEGTLSAFLGNLSFLHTLDFSNNSFNGRIPKEFGQLKELQTLSLSANKFSGSIPVDLGLLQKLEYLDLQSNKLENAIPSSLGTLPASLANCTTLQVLDLKENQLKGEFPRYYSNLDDLRVLSVGNNLLHGGIISRITNLTKLQVLDLSNNKFSGRIPWDLGKLQGFSFKGSQQLNAGALYVSLKIEIKGFEYSLIYILITNTILDLSNNNFMGEIPASIGSLRSLRLLNLSGNQLEGKIPISLGYISTLEQLDLAKNNMSGAIPQQLNVLSMLAYIDFSANHLCGPIPNGTQFSTFEASSYKKNKCLCGIPLHPCNIEMDKRKGHTSSKSINVKGWLSHVDENVSLIALGMGVRIGFGIIISMFITWERAKHWVLALPPKTPPPFFYRVY